MICPMCNGKGESQGFACGPTGGRIGAFPCLTCKGTGEITEEHVARIVEGQRLFEDRQARNVSQREEAKRLGMSVVLYSKVEHGDLTMEEARKDR